MKFAMPPGRSWPGLPKELPVSHNPVKQERKLRYRPSTSSRQRITADFCSKGSSSSNNDTCLKRSTLFCLVSLFWSVNLRATLPKAILPCQSGGRRYSFDPDSCSFMIHAPLFACVYTLLHLMV